MRFIFNFIFFGLIFYALWFFFPEAFAKLVDGAGAVFNFIKDLVNSLIDKLNHTRSPASPPVAPAIIYYFAGQLFKR